MFGKWLNAIFLNVMTDVSLDDGQGKFPRSRRFAQTFGDHLGSRADGYGNWVGEGCLAVTDEATPLSRY